MHIDPMCSAESTFIFFLFGGNVMSFLLRAGCCLVVFVAFVVPANLNGQIVYTITGFANNFGEPGEFDAPEVGPGESYVAEFVVCLLYTSPSPRDRG